MKILFDQGTPVPLRRQLLGHTIDTVYEQGWATLTNGQLLTMEEQARYDLLITTDQNLRYQQNLHGRLSWLPSPSNSILFADDEGRCSKLCQYPNCRFIDRRWRNFSGLWPAAPSPQ